MATRKVRIKKLNSKTALSVLREDQIDENEYESLTSETQIATGVEANEESEYHLQAVLQGPVSSTDKEIPVPPPQESDVNYDGIYPGTFSQTSNYIRFSQTVEECVGCQYDMAEDDEAFLTSYNQKKSAASRLSEDDFEQIMEVFEDTASVSTPFASVDKTVVPYEMMVPNLNQLETAKIMPHAKDIYEYWKTQRLVRGGALHPSLKFETHQENDDMDPYVCFRRREVRQTRKTRARDVQSAEKLKRLRRELEDGRQLILLSHDRELLKRDLLSTDRLVFEQRTRLKDNKVRLGIKDHDEDLINQKREKRKAPDFALSQRTPGSQTRLPSRLDGRPAEVDLTLLRDVLAEKENEMRAEIETKIENHRRWNQNHVDVTRDPLGPVKGQSVELSFRPAKTQYLMTPPASASSESMEEPTAMDLDHQEAAPMFHFRGVPQDSGSSGAQPAFRRRIGRLNRLWIDRRGLSTPPRETSSDEYSDRWKYDQDDSDNEQPVYEVDPFDIRALKFRASIPLYGRQVPGSSAIQPNGVVPTGKAALPAAPQQPNQAAS